MSIETTVVTLLQTTGRKVYPMFAPAGAPVDDPYIVWQKISSTPIRTHGGNAMKRSRFQFSIWSKNYSDLPSVSDEISAVFDLNQAQFELSTLEGEIDASDPEPGLFRRILDFFIWHAPEA
jgi:hypothetical protein